MRGSRLLASFATRNEPATRARCLRLTITLLTLVLASCGDAAAPKARAPESSKVARAPLYRGSVLDYAPAAGLSWLLVLRPKRVLESAAVAENLELLIPEERWDAFEAATGIRVRDVPSAAVASYGMGTLYLAELPPGLAPTVRERFALRVTSEPILSEPRPGLSRIRGTAGGVPRVLVTLDDRLLAVAARDPTLARIVEAYAVGKLRSPTVLRGAALAELPALEADTVAAFYAPGPFEGEWAGAARGLLGAATAARIAISDAQGGQVRATLTIAGEWPSEPAPEQQLDDAFRDLIQSSTGKLLALERASDIRVSFRPPFLTLTANLPLAPIARGLRAAVIADVWEILELNDGKREPESR
jgi:hypothetical protein